MNNVSEKLVDIDGNVYTIIKIGKQYWTVENLKTTRFNDGSPITYINNERAWYEADDYKTPAYCFYNDDARSIEYGALYNWYAVNTGKLAPKGWRVPTNDDWSKSAIGATSSGFSVLLGGYRYHDGSFDTSRSNGRWWGATESGASSAYFRYLSFSIERSLFRCSFSKGCGLSVRLVRDCNE